MAAAPALIGLAHGSRDPRAARAIDALMGAAGAGLPGVTSASAFLDLNPPDLTETLRTAGCAHAVVVPLLFTEAFHARVDVPEAVAAAAAATGVELAVAPILGLGDAVVDALADRARAAGIADTADVLLLAVGSSRPEANRAVADLAAVLSARRAGPVHAAFATCAPRATDVLADLRGQGRDVAVVPLFLAPGLLLDQVAEHPAAAGVPIAEVLGTSLAALVAQRYRDVVTASG